MMIDKVIVPNSLRARPGEATIDLRLPWYRTLPLSTVEVEAVKVDGAPIDADRLTFDLNGQSWNVSDMRGLTGENWFVTDIATLHIAGLQLQQGTTHDVEVLVNLYPPYILGMRRAVRWTRSMEAN